MDKSGTSKTTGAGAASDRSPKQRTIVSDSSGQPTVSLAHCKKQTGEEADENFEHFFF